MEFEFMTADTVLPPCMPLPAAMLRLPISSTAKVMYARLLDATLAGGAEDTNGIPPGRLPSISESGWDETGCASVPSMLTKIPA